MAGQRVLVDTGPLVALMNKRDRHHQRFVEYFKFFQGQLVTTWPVLTEVTHQVPVGKAVEIIAVVRDGALEVIELGNAGARTRLDEEVRGAVKIISAVEEPAVIVKIVTNLGFPARPLVLFQAA